MRSCGSLRKSISSWVHPIAGPLDDAIVAALPLQIGQMAHVRIWSAAARC
jgi:hypothetical protein